MHVCLYRMHIDVYLFWKDVGIEEEKEHAVHQNSNNQFEELQQKFEKLREDKHEMEAQLKLVIENLQSEVRCQCKQ